MEKIRLYVGGITGATKEEDIVALLGRYGRVTNVEINTKRLRTFNEFPPEEIETFCHLDFAASPERVRSLFGSESHPGALAHVVWKGRWLSVERAK